MIKDTINGMHYTKVIGEVAHLEKIDIYDVTNDLQIITEKHRISMTEYLQWNDRNGTYTDENCRLEGIEPLEKNECLLYVAHSIYDVYVEDYDMLFWDIEKLITDLKEKNLYNDFIKEINIIINKW